MPKTLDQAASDLLAEEQSLIRSINENSATMSVEELKAADEKLRDLKSRRRKVYAGANALKGLPKTALENLQAALAETNSPSSEEDSK